MLDRAAYKRALDQINLILLEVWDPIGVKGDLESREEYTGYAPVVMRLLMEGASEEVICTHLADVETKHMGLNCTPAGRLVAGKELLGLGLNKSCKTYE